MAGLLPASRPQSSMRDLVLVVKQGADDDRHVAWIHLGNSPPRTWCPLGPPYPSLGCLGTLKHPIPTKTLREALQGDISALDPRNLDVMTTRSVYPDPTLDVETGEERPCISWLPSLLTGFPVPHFIDTHLSNDRGQLLRLPTGTRISYPGQVPRLSGGLSWIDFLGTLPSDSHGPRYTWSWTTL